MLQDVMVQTQIQEFVEAPPVSAGELTVWLKHGIVARREPTAWLQEVPRVTANNIAYLIANILKRPLVRGSVSVRRQAGRFAEVSYKPRQRPDPTVVMTIIPGAGRYHSAALAFSGLANRSISTDWWYEEMQALGRRVAVELAQLQPCLEEANLVMNWLLDRITFGEPEPEPKRRNNREGFSW